MCQHCSAQAQSYPEGNRQGVSFTPFQNKPHIEKLKSAISPESIPNIPTSASASDTFSTPPVLNSTAQKSYSWSKNIPPQDLGVIMSAILSLRYNILLRASHILNPTLNLLIKSSISSSSGHPTPAFHIPQDLSTIFEHLQLEPLIENYIFCPQCFLLTGLTESVKTEPSHFKLHNEPTDHDSPCTQSLGKFIHLVEPHTQNTT
ncbi:hypothetical protein O181_013359 [Austropuccinia psidii MF-1]|uniref:Uncharacterized protein n=1 Tax=Austropuccinia psidii MF-1 TaxID=1389203 RepID=A0A9Q3BY27_9BASI|nr:hypothetical protein [Austropuccinia psidii MF-1]